MTNETVTSHLPVRVMLGIVLGIACGLFFPQPVARVFPTFNGLFSALLDFIIPLLIVGLVTPLSMVSTEGPAGSWARASPSLPAAPSAGAWTTSGRTSCASWNGSSSRCCPSTSPRG